MPASCTIYIVDDDASVRRSLDRLMRSCGYQTLCYGSVNDLLAESRLTTPACVIADVTMLGASGITLPQALAARGERLPVILITANDTEEMRAEARRSGASAFLRKPVDDQALIDSIEWALESTRLP